MTIHRSHSNLPDLLGWDFFRHVLTNDFILSFFSHAGREADGTRLMNADRAHSVHLRTLPFGKLEMTGADHVLANPDFSTCCLHNKGGGIRGAGKFPQSRFR
ncbi:hypothetical protein HGR_07036 [Hylemonella gracilis ATCC 19624]|uniref:Uncharacterized protein n=1 Tax=Hylemonella gracilis ATCC 19624 TaxID=887062 RepID=F3KSH8_9BURK|nr:hypothetical protein HGR_07036 [Hylemonella gracilis ATCC 19624]